MPPLPLTPPMTAKEIAGMFADPYWREKFPPILSRAQAALLAQVPEDTIYSWSSQGLLASCKSRAGKHLRLFRDRFVQLIAEGKLHGSR